MQKITQRTMPVRLTKDGEAVIRQYYLDIGLPDQEAAVNSDGIYQLSTVAYDQAFHMNAFKGGNPLFYM